MARKKRRNLNAQAKYVVAMSERLGSSKTADRENSKVAGTEDITLYYIYSIRELSAMKDISRQIVGYVRENYPHIRMLKDITVEMMQEFVDHKVESREWRTPKTIKARCNQIRKFGRMVSKTYSGASVDFTSVAPPQQDKTQPRSRGMTDREVSAMHDKLMSGRSSARFSPGLFASSGVRLEELIHIHHEDVDLEKGTVFIRNGKNGKHRYAVILHEWVPFWKNVLDQARAEGWINLTGCRFDTDEELKKNKEAVSKAMTRAKKSLGIDTKQTSHAIRKNYCQTYYGRLRDMKYSSRRAWNMLKESIGHGEANRLDLKRLYLEELWNK